MQARSIEKSNNGMPNVQNEVRCSVRKACLECHLASIQQLTHSFESPAVILRTGAIEDTLHVNRHCFFSSPPFCLDLMVTGLAGCRNEWFSRRARWQRRMIASDHDTTSQGPVPSISQQPSGSRKSLSAKSRMLQERAQDVPRDSQYSNV